MSAACKWELAIDHGHDYYTIEIGTENNPEAITLDLWSRGTFGVNIVLSREDAQKLSGALRDATLVLGGPRTGDSLV